MTKKDLREAFNQLDGKITLTETFDEIPEDIDLPISCEVFGIPEDDEAEGYEEPIRYGNDDFLWDPSYVLEDINSDLYNRDCDEYLCGVEIRYFVHDSNLNIDIDFDSSEPIAIGKATCNPADWRKD